jgi:Cysteine-rich CWC
MKMTTEIKEKLCESCGKKFSCGANIGKCWCFEVELKTEALKNIAEEFGNCLCEDCLREKNRSKIDL